jgi:hypothetical protein
MFFINNLDQTFKKPDARPACQLASCGIRSVRIDADGESNREETSRTFMAEATEAPAKLLRKAAKAGR